MAAAAQEFGLHYLGIADHSRSSIQAHGLDEARLRVQIATIRKLNKKFDGFRFSPALNATFFEMVHSIFRDEVLADLDFAVAPCIRFSIWRSGNDEAHHPRHGKSVYYHARHTRPAGCC